ncbi:MAG: hypothetical protein JSV46_04965, partial [Candidatus Aminicenantes bacterium]
MTRRINIRIFLSLLLFVSLVFSVYSAAAEQKKPLTVQDMMKFKHIRNPVISEDGGWIAYGTQPDRGDGDARIHSLKANKVYTVERGSRPVISKDSGWVAMIVRPEAAELEKETKKKPQQGMALVETSAGKTIHFEKVEKFAFSDDSHWLAYQHFKEEEKPKAKEKAPEEEKEKKPPEKKPAQKKRKSGSTLVLRHLESGKETQIPYVLSFAFDSSSRFLAHVVADPEGKDNGLYTVDLKKDTLPQSAIVKSADGVFVYLVWTKKRSTLAYLSKPGEIKDKDTKGFSLWIWDGETGKSAQAVAAEDAPQGWFIPERNRVSWSRDGKRLFFGFKPEEFYEEEEEEKAEEEEEIDLFDVEKILEKREVDVWHWNDPLIIPNQKIMWPRVKDQTYTAVYHLESKRMVPLTDKDMPRIQVSEHSDFALGVSDVPYRKEQTWYGRLNDIYLVSIRDGSRKKVASRLENRYSLSPGGRYVLYYKDKHWHLYDENTGSTRNLTAELNVPFFDEDHDYPSKVPGYGYAGWLKDDKAVLIYDKYDIWQFSTKTGQASNITAGTGRENDYTFRVLRLDPEKDFFDDKETLLLSAYHNFQKSFGFYECRTGSSGVNKLLEEKKRFRFLGKSKNADALMYTRESYQEYPDIWVSDRKFQLTKKITDANPQISEFAWGSAELVEWNSIDGIPLQGVLIKPGNYEPGKKYPVVVY